MVAGQQGGGRPTGWRQASWMVAGQLVEAGQLGGGRPTGWRQASYSLSTLSWLSSKTRKIGIHLTENRSNQPHVIFDGR